MKTLKRLAIRLCYVAIGVYLGIMISGKKQGEPSANVNEQIAEAMALSYQHGCVEAYAAAYGFVPQQQALQCQARGLDIAQKILLYIEGGGGGEIQDSDLPLSKPGEIEDEDPQENPRRSRPAVDTSSPEVA